MEELKSSKPESTSAEGKKEEKEVKEKVEKEEVELVENNNCLPPAVTMDEMELLKKLEEANRYERILTLIRCCKLASRCVNASQNRFQWVDLSN